MKKFLILVLGLALLVSSAYADSWSLFSIELEGSLRYFGLDGLNNAQISKLSVNKENDTVFIDYGAYNLAFTFDGDSVVSAAARLMEESASMDYIMSCLAIITTLGDVDFSAYGILMNQLAYARRGKRNLPNTIGEDHYVVTLQLEFGKQRV